MFKHHNYVLCMLEAGLTDGGSEDFHQFWLFIPTECPVQLSVQDRALIWICINVAKLCVKLVYFETLGWGKCDFRRRRGVWIGWCLMNGSGGRLDDAD